jgi:alkylation response protein AidB-like acyl-CoA dehydrogenase
MDLTTSPEQDEIISSSAAFLRDRMPITRIRALFDEPSNVDDAAWGGAAELGWFFLGLPEANGGVGFGLADEVHLFREIGRGLATGPFLSTVLAARVAAFAGDAALAEAIGGGQRVGIVIPGSSTLIGADGSLTGPLQLLDCEADGLALAVSPEQAVLVRVADLTGVAPVACIDPGVRLCRADAAGVAPIARVTADVDPVQRRGHVLAAAMLVGINEAVRDLSAEHAKSRVQFDKPIGVNQAIKHPCADMAVRAQLGYAQSIFAAVANDEGREDADYHAISAHLAAGEYADLSAAATVQIMGGMGFTFEHDAHLYCKRAFVLGQLFGGTSTQLGRLLDLPSAR